MDNAKASRLAEIIVNSEPVITTYAACEWDELSEDGKLWVAEIVRQAVLIGAGFWSPPVREVLIP